MSPLCEARKEEKTKNEKTTLCKTWFFSWFAHTGLYVTPVRGKEGGKNEKTKKPHFVKRGFFRGLPIRASMSPLCEARKEEKTKNEKTTLCKTCFFRGLPIRASMSPLCEARKEEKTKNEKTTLCKTWFFSWFAHTGLYVTPVRGKEGGKKRKTKKPHFVKRVFFVVCPYGPLCHPCARQGRRKKRKTKKPHFVKRGFFRGLPIRASMSPLCEARKEEKTKNEKTTLCKTWFFSWFAHTGLYVTPVRGKEEGKNEKRKNHTL